MSDINRVLFTAKESLLSHLTAINVTGSNISNVNTAGYSRLRPIFESVGTKDASSDQTQVGVKIAEVQRIYDKFLVQQLVSQEAQVGDSQAQKDLLTRVESVLNENTGGGINDALSKFWSAWGDLSTNPSGKAQRDALVSAAENLADMFQQRSSDLSAIQADANQSIADTVTTLNGYLQDMSTYNGEIVKIEIAGGQATDLRDKRDELLRKISSIIDVNYLEKSDGSDYVYLSNGKALVEETNVWSLDVQSNADNSSLYDVVLAADPTRPLNNYITSGKLSGLLAIRDNDIPAYIDEINQTAASIINKVNEQHASGYDQDGNVGGTFFTPTAQAKYMEVSAAIIADTRKIAASATVNGDGDNAKAMVTIQADQIYASLGTINSTDSSPAAVSSRVGAGAGLTLNDSIILTRGATAANWTVTTQTNYPAMVILSADANTVTIDADNDGMADISLALSGTWETGDTAAFTVTAAGPTVSAVTATDVDSGASQDHYAVGQINNIGQIYKNTQTGHPITITRGAAADTWTVTDNGGYDNLTILSANAQSVALDMDGNGTADITVSLSGTWEQNDALSFSLTKSENTTTIDGYYNAFIGRIGQDVADSSTALERQTAIINQFSDQKEALSGVSLDEEMLNLVKYQMGYNAASRLTTTVTEMMDLLINLGK
ncbi:MAG: flagellar hook-associated protein FlgK [Smithellaceae bacterium]